MFKKKNKTAKVIGTHIAGLDIAENMNCILTLSESGIVISAPDANKEYTLSLDRIDNISWHHEEEIEKHLKSSAAKGIIGAAVFGLPGAIIGSRPKEKKQRKVHFFITIDYPDNQIVIQTEDGYSCGQTIDYFRKFKPQSAEIKTISL